MSDLPTYAELKQELAETQSALSHDQIADRMARKSDYTLDLNNLPGQTHHWVDRGTVMSCEGAGHPTHRSYKRRK